MALTVTYVGSNFIQATPTTSLAVGPYNQVAGNTIVILVETYEGSGNTLSSITDTAGNTYVPIIAPQGFTSGNSAYLNMYFVRNCLGSATNTVTVHYSGAGVTFSTMAYYDLGGLDLGSPFDVDFTSSGNSASATSASYTLNSVNEIILAFAGTESGFLKFTAVNAGFTLDDGEVGGSGTGISGSAHKIVSTLQTAQTVTFTLMSSNPWNVLLAGFQLRNLIGVTPPALGEASVSSISIGHPPTSGSSQTQIATGAGLVMGNTTIIIKTPQGQVFPRGS